jgi:hypothetical protein
MNCEVCHSEKYYGKECGLCHGRDATEDAIHRAKLAFYADKIDIEEFERRLDRALTDLPLPSYDGIALQLG